MIEAPREDKKRAAVRVLVEALAQGWAVTAGLAHVYRFTHPTEMERAIEAWRAEITDTVNEHDRLLKAVEAKLLPRSEIGSTALALAIWVVEQSADGLQNAVDFDTLRAAFSEATKGELEEACFELEHLGFVEIEGALGRAVLDVSPTYALYWAFDPMVMKTDPTADARQVASRLLEDARLGSIPLLEEAMGWPRRRLNPAIARLMPLIRTKSGRIQNRFPTTSFSIQSEDRFRLKRFIGESE